MEKLISVITTNDMAYNLLLMVNTDSESPFPSISLRDVEQGVTSPHAEAWGYRSPLHYVHRFVIGCWETIQSGDILMYDANSHEIVIESGNYFQTDVEYTA